MARRGLNNELKKKKNVCIVYFTFLLNAIQQPHFVFKLAMWKMLLALPSPNTLEEYWLRITPYRDLRFDRRFVMPRIF